MLSKLIRRALTVAAAFEAQQIEFIPCPPARVQVRIAVPGGTLVLVLAQRGSDWHVDAFEPAGR